jgi:putative chitinase
VDAGDEKGQVMTKMTGLLAKVAPKAYPNYVRAFEGDDALFTKYKINTPIRIAHFLAQVLHECGRGAVLFENLRYRTGSRLLEIFGVGNHSAAVRKEEVPGLLGNPQALGERVYGLGNPKKAAELGNTRPGDGYRYRGGGLMQTTGAAKYKAMGEKAGADFYADPNLIVDPAYALKPAIYEWAEGDCNAYADKNNIRTITKIINGGYNGLAERQALFAQIWSVVSGAKTAAWDSAPPDPETRWLQEALNDLGADPLLLVDGRYGPATEEAVRWLQEIASLKVDGIAGDVTRAAINLRLAAT